MCGDTRHRRFPPPARHNRIAVRVAFEPCDGRPEHSGPGQCRRHRRLDRAQVLTDDERAGPGRLEGEEPQHGIGVVADVRTGRGRVTGRDPPQPE